VFFLQIIANNCNLVQRFYLTHRPLSSINDS